MSKSPLAVTIFVTFASVVSMSTNLRPLKVKAFTLAFAAVATATAVSCAHKPAATTPEEANPCFRIVAEGNIPELQKNLSECKKANNKSATSLMMLAASRDQVAVLEFLFNAENKNVESLNEYDLSGDTPLFYAAATSKTKALNWLLENGAATKSFRADGISAFMIAIQSGNKASFEAFLKSKSQIEELNTPNEDGWTPLFYAVRQENLGLVKSLLELGATPMILSKENDTPLTLADEQQWKEGVQLIKKYSQKKKKRN